MAAFGARLSAGEIDAVATFITREFLRCQIADSRYHSPENGWSAEDPETLAAAAFVTGQIPYDQAPEQLNAEMRRGQAIFLESCITCHRGRHYGAEEAEEEAELPAFAAVSSLHAEQVLSPVSSPVKNEQANNFSDEEQSINKHEEEHFSEIYDRSAGVAAASLTDKALALEDLTEKERQGRDFYERDCQLCHGYDGSGNNWIGQFLQPNASDLRSWLVRSDAEDDAELRKRIAYGKPGSSMPDFASVLSEGELDAILAYMRRAFQLLENAVEE